MPRRKRTLKTLDEARELLASKPKRRRRTPFEIQADNEEARKAKQMGRLNARGVTQELLDSLGVTAATQTPHFLNDGMISSPFIERPHEPLIPYLQAPPLRIHPLDFLKTSYALEWWRKQNLKEKKALQEGQPLNQWLCPRWAGPHFYNIGYIREEVLYAPGANGVTYCDVVPLEEQDFFLACCPPLANFLRDMGCTFDGSFPTRHLLTNAQRKANDDFRKAHGLDGPHLPFKEYRHNQISLSRPNTKEPYGPDNIAIRFTPNTLWLLPTTRKDKHPAFLRRIHRKLRQFVFDHGQPAIDLLDTLQRVGPELTKETVLPLFGKYVKTFKGRVAYVGPIDEAARLLNTSQKLLRDLRSHIEISNNTADFPRRYKDRHGLPDIPKDLFTLGLTWPDCLWEEAVPPDLLKQALKEHITFHRPWRLPRKDAERLIGPELYAWIRDPRRGSNDERAALWRQLQTTIALEATDWWVRDWRDARRKIDNPALFDLIPIPSSGKDFDHRWRASSLFDLLDKGTHIDILDPYGKILQPPGALQRGRRQKPPEPRITHTVHRQNRLLPLRQRELYFQTIRTFGAYALSGPDGIENDWWLLATIASANKQARDGTYSSSRVDAAGRENLEDRRQYKLEDYALHAVAPDGRTRPCAYQAREAWERSIRSLTRTCAGEPAEGAYRSEPNPVKWRDAMDALKALAGPDVGEDGDGDFPEITHSYGINEVYLACDPFVARAMTVINRNRHFDQAWIDHLRELDRERQKKREEEWKAREAREQKRQKQLKAGFDRRVARLVKQGVDPKTAQSIEFARALGVKDPEKTVSSN